MPFGALRPGAVRQAPGAAFVEREPVGVSKTRGGAEPRNVGGKQPWHKGFVVALAMLHHRQVPERIAGAGEVEEAQQSAGRKEPCAFRQCRDQRGSRDFVNEHGRSEERSVGKERVSTCRSRWSP